MNDTPVGHAVALEGLPGLVGAARASEIIASIDDYDAVAAGRYGWVNRAIPDAELDGLVEALARRLASFDTRVLAAAKALIRRRAPGSTIDDYRETLEVLRQLIASPETAARRTGVAARAAAAWPDFELNVGRHLGPADSHAGDGGT